MLHLIWCLETFPAFLSQISIFKIHMVRSDEAYILWIVCGYFTATPKLIKEEICRKWSLKRPQGMLFKGMSKFEFVFLGHFRRSVESASWHDSAFLSGVTLNQRMDMIIFLKVWEKRHKNICFLNFCLGMANRFLTNICKKKRRRAARGMYFSWKT